MLWSVWCEMESPTSTNQRPASWATIVESRLYSLVVDLSVPPAHDGSPMIYCRRRQWLTVGDILFVFMQTGRGRPPPPPSFPPDSYPWMVVVEITAEAEEEEEEEEAYLRGEPPRFRDGIQSSSPHCPTRHHPSPWILFLKPQSSASCNQPPTTSPPIDGPVGMRLPSQNHTKRRQKAWRCPSTAAAVGPITVFLDFCGSSPSMAI